MLPHKGNVGKGDLVIDGCLYQENKKKKGQWAVQVLTQSYVVLGTSNMDAKKISKRNYYLTTLM